MGKWKINAAKLVANLALFNKQNAAVIPYTPSKTEVNTHEERYFRSASPERHGIPSARLYNMLTALENEPGANLHNLLVLKDGEVIAECSAPGYSTEIRHLAHSMTKSIIGLAIGFLYDEGAIDLDAKIADFFPEYEPKSKKFYDITVRHALIMSTGIFFGELGAVTDTDWTRAYFESKVSFTPGTMFAYNSMNTYILARIVAKISGMTITEFLTPRLFSPLGIKNVFWEMGPEGVEKGGWGIYLSAESWAKIGLMLSNYGTFEGKRILSSEWIRESTTKKIDVTDRAGGYDYGYQMWVGRGSDTFLLSGMLGQNVWISPKNSIVAITSSENNELFPKSPALEIIEKYLGEIDKNDGLNKGTGYADLKRKERTFFRERMWARPRPLLKGLTYRLGLRSRAPFVDEWSRVLGKYTLAKNSQSLLPFFIRALQNNHAQGIEALSLTRDGESLILSTVEGGKEHCVRVGFYDYESSIVDFNGEKYLVRALCEYATTEHGAPLYKISVIFPEMPNSRRITISFGSEGQIIVKLTEIPDKKVAQTFVEGLYTMSPTLSFVVKLIERRLGDKFIVRRLESLFAPTLVGAREDSYNFKEIIEKENKKAEKELSEDEAAASMFFNLSDDVEET